MTKKELLKKLTSLNDDDVIAIQSFDTGKIEVAESVEKMTKSKVEGVFFDDKTMDLYKKGNLYVIL